MPLDTRIKKFLHGVRLWGKPVDTDDASAWSLEELWSGAEHLGRVKLEQDSLPEGYKATIFFTLPSGSFIWAEGKDPDKNMAILKAIKEATLLRYGNNKITATVSNTRKKVPVRSVVWEVEEEDPKGGMDIATKT